MILEEYIQVHIAGKNLKYYLDKGYDAKNGEVLFVKNEDVSTSSKILEKRICDVDGKEYTRTHREWTHTKECFGIDLCPDCARKRTAEKVKKINLEKYGVEYPMQSRAIKQKAIETCLKNYGCAYSFQNNKVQEKAKASVKSKYGVNSITELPETIEKIKKTNFEKYGVENVFQSQEVKDKIKQTLLEKYEVENISQNSNIKEKVKNTFKERYGVEHALQFKDFNDKAKKTTLEKYGVEYAMQSKEIRDKAMKTLCDNGNVPTSQQQLEVYKMTKELFPKSEVNLNVACSGLSLDIEFILDSELKLDIEYDGYHWHQDEQKDRRRDEVVKQYGYKILRIKSNKALPTQEELKEAICYLKDNKEVKYSHIILDDWGK